jgi:UDP-glucose 4-epimerase
LDYVVHLAAIIGVQNVIERPYEVLVDNTRMLENVIELCRRQNRLPRLLFASTSEVYAGTLRYFGLEVPTPEHSPLAVEDLGSPRTSYMLSKIVGEAMCRNSQVPFTIFRPHNIYGPRMGMAHVIPEKLMQIWESGANTEIEVASPEHTRTFCFIDDATEMLVKIIENDKTSGETINLGADRPEVTINDVVRLCLKVTGKSLTLVPSSDTPGSPRRRAPEIATARRLLAFEPIITLEEGLERTWKWYRDEVFRAGKSRKN